MASPNSAEYCLGNTSMCSYTVREARTGAAPDSFQVGSIAPIVAGTPNGLIGLAACNVAAAGGFTWLTIPNSAIVDPKYCGGVLTNTNLDTTASPVTGDGAQFQILVTTLATQIGVAGTGFDLLYAQVGC